MYMNCKCRKLIFGAILISRGIQEGTERKNKGNKKNQETLK